jgi:hypothetical protein
MEQTRERVYEAMVWDAERVFHMLEPQWRNRWI